MPLRNSIVMATPKVPGDQKLFEKVCYMLKLKVTKSQYPTPTLEINNMIQSMEIFRFFRKKQIMVSKKLKKFVF